MRVIIIEDEELAQEELERLLNKRFPAAEVVGKFATVRESVDWLAKNAADLIFLDIHLADGNGFEIFEQTDVHAPVIFTTAYDQYAIQAFKVNGIGYLLKPIVESDFVAAVEKFNHFNHNNISALLENLRSPKEYKSRLVITKGDRIEFLQIDDIAYFYAEDRLTFVMTKDGKKCIVDYTIESLTSQLEPKKFFRITRGVIVSINSIKSIHRHFNGRLHIALSPDFHEMLFVSRARAAEFLKWLDDN